MKKPKINVKLKMPDKRPTIKNRFLKKNLLSLIVVAVLAIGTGTAYGTLSSQDADRGNDPVNGVNKDRYQVLISGKGYKLSKKQEKDYKLQKKQNEANVNKAMQNDSRVIRSSNGSRIFRSGSSSYRYSSSSVKTSKNPRVTTNISDQIDGLPSNVKSGEKLKFRVRAYAYPYGSKNVILSDNIKVTVVGGKDAKVYKEDKKKGYVYYEVELGEGTNKISISVTDKKNKKTAKLGPYKIDKVGPGSSSSGGTTDPSQNTGEQDLNLPVTVSVDLSDFGVDGISFSGTIKDKDTTAYDVLKNISDIKFSGDDIQYITGDMKNFTLDGFDSGELQRIFKKENSVSDPIDEADYADWLSTIENDVKEGGKIGTDCPKFKKGKSKWTYDKTKKGEDLADGIELTLTLYDD